jgi:hypothetical protein
MRGATLAGAVTRFRWTRHVFPGTHNVEFSLHPILRQQIIPLREFTLPLTTAKLRHALDAQKFTNGDLVAKPAQVLSTGRGKENTLPNRGHEGRPEVGVAVGVNRSENRHLSGSCAMDMGSVCQKVKNLQKELPEHTRQPH